MRRLFILTLIAFAVCQAYASPLETLISSGLIAQLQGGELIIKTHFGDAHTVISPKNNTLDQIIASAKDSFSPNIIVETLYLHKKPESFFSDNQSWNEEQKTNVFNQTLAISALTGVQYYSVSRAEMRTFYEFSNVIDDPRTKKTLPDPVYHEPVSMSLFARQKDLTFGDNIYRYDYTVGGDIIAFSQENVTTLSVGFIPVIRKGNLRSVLAVIDCGDSLLVYAVSMVNAILLPGMKDRILSSFSSRAEAILKWFSGRLDSELFK